MNKIVSICNSVAKKISEHSSEILIGAGSVSMLFGVIEGIRATPKALELIETEKKERGVCDLSLKDTFLVSWKPYIPTAALCATGIACIAVGTACGYKNRMAAMAAYALSESTYKTYRDGVIKALGKNKDDEVVNHVSKEAIEKTPVNNENIIITGSGDSLCFESISGRYFRSSIEKIRKIENDLNRQMRNENYVMLNDFYYSIGLPGLSIGDDLGWSIDRGYMEISFSAQISDNDEPCLVINYTSMPYNV